MKPCKTCGKMVSTNASKCPYCGERNPTFPRFSEMSTAGKAVYAGGVGISSIIFIIIFIIAFVFLLCFC